MPLEGDFDLCAILENTTLTTDDNEAGIVRYLCNLPFTDVLDPCRNSKFPGTMVVSLARKDLSLLNGVPHIHTPYKPRPPRAAAGQGLPWAGHRPGPVALGQELLRGGLDSCKGYVCGM